MMLRMNKPEGGTGGGGSTGESGLFAVASAVNRVLDNEPSIPVHDSGNVSFGDEGAIDFLLDACAEVTKTAGICTLTSGSVHTRRLFCKCMPTVLQLLHAATERFEHRANDEYAWLLENAGLIVVLHDPGD
jgi:hypothetical protein